ncbi:acyl-CoA dehydrogenase family protein [Blastococcus brunescens]|uniref:Acyl-CoA dehydrogenase family protein n=2 Tax=Blastococcus brunescens TaxID=1564165 RepID=A0ABZ1BAI0_9ACTN|nr:acyl-CoA dehydrogenase family protein [Blastococcus sp. BMG 8361]WRL66559.1 acyl-CoA dehydrogenase family protein [Blastococcus sp. BMG 8361]
MYYNRALAMAGTWHSSISTLLSAHQSIGLPEPLRLFGSEEQKRHWLPRLARDHVSAFLLTEPDVGSDPARMSTTAVPTGDGAGYLINGRKLWATNGAIADVVVIMAVVPESEGTGAASPRSSARATATASRSSTATTSWGCGGSRTR